MDWITNPEALVALLTLTLLEIVLGIDNVVFISILADRLPEAQRARARFIGLGLAMIGRIALLFSISWIMRLTEPLFSVLDHGVSGRDLILIVGGLFLVGKSTQEIHDKLEGEDDEHGAGAGHASFPSVITQILLLDLVFSLDSVLTAVGMARDLGVMVTAVVVAVAVMMWAAGSISRFVREHPTLKMLALAFLLLIGVMLIADGAGHHIPKGYIYFAMAFSILVEFLNLRVRARARRKAIRLREPRLQQALKRAEASSDPAI